jgi:hypothetical protein
MSAMTGAEEVLLIRLPLYDTPKVRADRRKSDEIAAPLTDQNRCRSGIFNKFGFAIPNISYGYNDLSG